MAKIKQNDFIGTVNDVINSAKEAGVVHLHAEGKSFNGRKISIGGKDHFHFGTTGYLGLEQDQRLKDAAIAAIQNYGTQFPLSKSYISHPLYAELEEKIKDMYGQPVIITKNSTLGHIAVIPSIVGDEDAVILDHQVHWSVQNAAQILKTRGVQVEMIRHNNLEMLEEKIRRLSSKSKRIWYLADGVYSMYGDYAPVKDLIDLSIKYSQLHLYFDDVHGMSWNGKNGTGYVASVLNEIPENVVLVSTLSKTFGASGAAVICGDKERHSRIKTFGGPLTFSAQLEPASVAAGIASAAIHLSDEIYVLQNELQDRINYFNDLLGKTDLPLIDRNNSPVFYIGTGMPITGYNFVQRLLRDGFYVNLGLFPAVPVKNTGVRITISRHNTPQDIRELVQAMVNHYPKALDESATNLEKVRTAFRISNHSKNISSPKANNLSLEVYDSILKVPKETWDRIFSGRGVMDWDGQLFLEKVFSNNAVKEHNWKFFYIIIKDKMNNIVLAAPLNYALWKDDLLAPASTSVKVEERRKSQGKYYLTSMVLSLGSMFTEGDHLFLMEGHPDKEQALGLLLDKMEEMEATLSHTQMLVLRDFDANTPFNSFLLNQGFIKADMPDACYFEDFSWNNKEDFPSILSRKSRRHFFKDIKPFENLLKVDILPEAEEEKLEKFRDLYENVRGNNPGLNTFPFPRNIFHEMSNHEKWEFLTISINEESSLNGTKELIGVMFCYKNGATYVPSFVGMDYTYSKQFSIYRQLLYQTILRAKELDCTRIDFGLTAAFEKKKLGGIINQKICYVQAKDNFSLELLETLQNSR